MDIWCVRYEFNVPPCCNTQPFATHKLWPYYNALRPNINNVYYYACTLMLVGALCYLLGLVIYTGHDSKLMQVINSWNNWTYLIFESILLYYKISVNSLQTSEFLVWGLDSGAMIVKSQDIWTPYMYLKLFMHNQPLWFYSAKSVYSMRIVIT